MRRAAAAGGEGGITALTEPEPVDEARFDRAPPREPERGLPDALIPSSLRINGNCDGRKGEIRGEYKSFKFSHDLPMDLPLLFSFDKRF